MDLTIIHEFSEVSFSDNMNFSALSVIFFFFKKDLVYCGNNCRENSAYKESKSVVHPAESLSPWMSCWKAWLGDLSTARNVGSWQGPGALTMLIKTCDKFMSSAQTTNCPRNHPGPSRLQRCSPSALALTIPSVLLQLSFAPSPQSIQHLLIWAWLEVQCLSPGNSQNAWRIQRVLDKVPWGWGFEVWPAHSSVFPHHLCDPSQHPNTRTSPGLSTCRRAGIWRSARLKWGSHGRNSPWSPKLS